MNTVSSNDVQDSYRVNAAVYFGTAAGVALILWGAYILEHSTSLRLVSRFRIAAAPEEPMNILYPIIGSVAAPIIGFIMWRRAVGIAENGVFVSAKVYSLGGAIQGMRHVTFTYAFEATYYSKKMSVSCTDADNFIEGELIEVIVDKRNPKRMMLK